MLFVYICSHRYDAIMAERLTADVRTLDNAANVANGATGDARFVVVSHVPIDAGAFAAAAGVTKVVIKRNLLAAAPSVVAGIRPGDHDHSSLF